jgi:hypothetical protein
MAGQKKAEKQFREPLTKQGAHITMHIVLQLLGVWRWLKSGLGTLLSLALRYPLQAALIVALVACGWLWHGKGKALAERDAARAQIATIAAAQQEAADKAKQARADAEQLTKDLAHATDQHAADLDAISRRALADRMRGQAARCASSGTVAAAVPSHSESDPGADTGGVYFTAAEADTLRRHEVRSTACHAWGQALIEAGVAVAE